MMKGQLAGLMKPSASRCRENMRRVQEQSPTLGGGGAIGRGAWSRVVMTCKHDVKRVCIDPSLMGDDKENAGRPGRGRRERRRAARGGYGAREDERPSPRASGLPPGMKLPF